MLRLLVHCVFISLGIALAIYLFAPSTPPGLDPDDFGNSSPEVKVALLRQQADKLNPEILIAALKDGDADVRLMAAMKNRVRNELDAKALIGALKDPHAGVRREAARTLGHSGSASTSALLEALEDTDPRVRAGAALAFGDLPGKIEPERPLSDFARALPLLENAVKDEDATVRQYAERTLERLTRYMEHGRQKP